MQPAALLTATLSLSTSLAAALSAPQGGGGAIAFEQACLDATTDAVVLNVAAHPDDEAARSMVLLRHQHGVRTVTLYSTCGEGGQNAIGREIGRKLASIRVQETMNAAIHTGTEVRWLGFADFGYSKTLEETLAVWGREKLLTTMRATLADVDPDAVFTNHSLDRGHGHHRASAWAVQQLVAELGERDGQVPVPLYERVFAGDAVIAFDPFAVDGVRGTTFARQAHRGWLEHASQGPWGAHDPQRVRRENWRQVFPPVDAESGRAGVIQPLAGLGSVFVEPAFVAAAAKRRVDVAALSDAMAAFRADRSRLEHVNAARTLLPQLLALRDELGTGPGAARAMRRLDRRVDALHRVIAFGSGVSIETWLSAERLVPGTVGKVRVAVRGPGFERFTVACQGESTAVDSELRARQVLEELLVSAERQRADGDDRGALDDALRAKTIDPRDPRVTRLLEALDDAADADLDSNNPIADMFGTRGPRRLGPLPAGWAELPIHVPAAARDGSVDPFLDLTGIHFVPLTVRFELDGLPIELHERVALRSAPGLELEFARELTTVPAAAKWTRVVSLEVSWNGGEAVERPVTVRHPAGIVATSIPPTVRLSPERPKARVLVRLTGEPGAPVGRATIAASVGDAVAARLDVQPLDLTVSRDLKIGLVRGPDDTVDRFLADHFVDYAVLDETELAVRDLAEFDVVVLDIRVYHHRPDLANHRDRLLAFCRGGGRVVTFYHKPGEWNERPGKPLLAPFALKVGTKRVAEEDAAIVLERPEHPLLSTPHRIGLEDFDGWVQERMLNAPSEWDPAWVTLLSSHDEGEEPLTGGLLHTRYGRGDFVYCSLALYRQIRIGHAGAARLLVNLLTP